MDWKDVGAIVGKAAPVLGAVLGGPVGAIAGAAGSLISRALGCEDAPETVTKAIQADPNAMIKLKALEVREQAQLLNWQAQQLQAGIQQQANEGQELEQRLKNEFAQEQAKYQKAFNDSVEHFIQAYNKDKKYSYILMRGGMVNTILYADKAYDITNDVVKGLNKAYTGMKKK